MMMNVGRVEPARNEKDAHRRYGTAKKNEVYRFEQYIDALTDENGSENKKRQRQDGFVKQPTPVESQNMTHGMRGFAMPPPIRQLDELSMRMLLSQRV